MIINKYIYPIIICGKKEIGEKYEKHTEIFIYKLFYSNNNIVYL